MFNRELSSSELNTLWDYYATKYVLGLGPVLAISVTNPNNLAVSWPSPSTGLVLQESTNLNAGSWTNSTNTVNDDGKTRSVIVNRAPGRKYFRLKD